MHLRLYIKQTVSNQNSLIGLVSSKNYYRRPSLLQTWHKGVIWQGGTRSGGDTGGRVRGKLQGIGTAIVYTVATQETFTISSGNLFRHGAIRTLNACWRRWIFTSLLVNLESMTAKPGAGGSSKNRVAWKVEKAVHYFVQTFFTWC